MTGPTVSVIVVSRGRPRALVRCLTAVSQLVYHPCEVVVVADAAGVAAVGQLAFANRIKIVQFDDANIASARNRGLGLAAGQIVGFLDDDAVPEPGWLFHLTQAFANGNVAAAGGYVRGRNGISFQWKMQEIDQFGFSTNMDTEPDDLSIFIGEPGRALKTQGTNCAFRRDILAELGGFDPAFRYYLDEADLNLRLAKREMQTAIVPLAEVHHGFEPSATRMRSRVRTSLFEIGASQVVFLRKHSGLDRFDRILSEFYDAQKAVLTRHMVAGNCEPRDIEPIMKSLVDGFAEGAARQIIALPTIPPVTEPFVALRADSELPTHVILSGYRLGSEKLRRQAREAVRPGHIVSLYLFSRTTVFHRVIFRDGYWEQSGGLFGKSVRSGPIFRIARLKQRLKRETQRVASQRDPQHSAT